MAEVPHRGLGGAGAVIMGLFEQGEAAEVRMGEEQGRLGLGGAAGLAPDHPGRRTRHRMAPAPERSEEHTSELQSLMRISYAVFCLKKKTKQNTTTETTHMSQ